MQETTPRAITWEAPEYEYKKKGADWYFSFFIIVAAVVIIAFIFDNALFALLLIVSGLTLGMLASKKPSIVSYAVTLRGVKVDDRIYPFSTLKSYYINEENPTGPQLLVLTKHHFMPLLVIPIPAEHVDDIDNILKGKIKEEELEESSVMKMLENFGF